MMANGSTREAMAGAGTYILRIAVAQPLTLEVGRLGAVAFPSGDYLYVGSALRGLRARLARHLRREKRLHWHIDVFLQHARVEEIWYRPGGERLECAWARALAEVSALVPWGRRFGSSDCRCATHLYHAQGRLEREEIWRVLPGGEGVEVWEEPGEGTGCRPPPTEVSPRRRAPAAALPR